MLFNTESFFIFFILVYTIYVFSTKRYQNALLLTASYYFYAYWDYRFLALILISTIVDYLAAIALDKAHKEGRNSAKKLFLWLSIGVNLSILGFFKYFNFFASNLAAIMEGFGISLGDITYNIILPVGISFYTFQTMSYTIDVYRGRLTPCRNPLDFALFVAFFPQLMAGPIERASKLIPQIQNERVITEKNLTDGSWLIFWGLFKKLYIADNLAPYTHWALTLNGANTSVDIYLSLFALAIRFYCDFSGYSDIARGLARVMGFQLSLNFNLPYFSANPGELWSRWHITLSNWFRDYVYAPIRKTFFPKKSKHMAAIPTMMLVGFWHGANWTYIIWGLLWGLALVGHRYSKPYIDASLMKIPYAKSTGRFLSVLLTFQLWLLLGLIFGNASASEVFNDSKILFGGLTTSEYTYIDMITIFYYSWPLIIMQAAQYARNDLNVIKKVPFILRCVIYILLIFLIIQSGAAGDAEFIYFQF